MLAMIQANVTLSFGCVQQYIVVIYFYKSKISEYCIR